MNYLDDRFSAANSLRREYDSLMEQKQFLLKENQDLREFDRQMQQKLTSHHEVLKMLSTNIQTVKLEVQRLESIKEELLNRAATSSSSNIVESSSNPVDTNTNCSSSSLPSSLNDTDLENCKLETKLVENILSTTYTEELLTSMDDKDILLIIQTLQQAVHDLKK